MRPASMLCVPALIAALTACGPAPAPAPVPPQAEAWLGRWIGVEGTLLDLERAGAPGRYRLRLTLLDGVSEYEAAAEGGQVVFERAGRRQVLRAATGDETGLKWLAGKRNCLMTAPGEGFCRD